MIPLTIHKCKRCKTQLKKNQIRYDLEGKNLICIECLKQIKKYKKSKENLPKEVKFATNKKKLFCFDCTYRFSVKKTSEIKPFCPYCNSKNIRDNNFSVEKVINDSESSLHDW